MPQDLGDVSPSQAPAPSVCLAQSWQDQDRVGRRPRKGGEGAAGAELSWVRAQQVQGWEEPGQEQSELSPELLLASPAFSVLGAGRAARPGCVSPASRAGAASRRLSPTGRGKDATDENVKA